MLPVSALFDVVDWNPRASTAADGSATAGSSHGFIANAVVSGTTLASGSYAAFFALAKNAGAGVVTTVARVDEHIPTDSYTFEIELLLTDDTPKDCSDPSYRIFIGLNKQLGRGAGFLVTKRGLYLANSPADTTPSHLAGTDKYLYDEQGVPQRVVIRAIVDNTSNRLSLYIGPTDAAYDPTNGATWWAHPALALQHNVAAKGDSDAVDGIRVALSAPVGYDAVLLVYAARVSTSQLVPIARPVAVISSEWQLAVSQATILSGQNSYDKYGAPLTYDWTIENAPSGSQTKLQGAVRSSATTVVGVATAADVVVTYLPYTSAGNDLSLVIEDPGAVLSPLEISINANILRVRCATDGAGVVNTTASSLVQAFSSPLNGAYSERIASLFSAELADPLLAGSGVLVPGTYSFSGGTGSSLPSPLFVPDVVGPYVISLRVDNGTVTSPKELVTLSVTVTDELHGEIPDSNYIFKYLPDFWNMVKGREHLSTAWSAINQIITSDMVQAWQNDYSKSIRDIGREFQRRWLSFDNKITATDNYLAAVVSAAGAIDDVVATTTVGTSGYTAKSAVVNTAYAKAPLHTGPVLYRATDYPPRVLTVSTATASGATWIVSSSTSEFSTCHRVANGSALREIGGASVTDPAHNMRFETHVGDVVRSTTSKGLPVKSTITGYSQDGSEATIATPLGITAWDKQAWEVVRPVTTHRLTRMPYFVFSGGLLSSDLSFGDLAVIAVTSPYTSNALLLPCTVLAFTDTFLFVDLAPVLDALTQESQLTETPTNWRYNDLVPLAVSVSYFLRTSRTAQVTDLTRVPTLGTTTLSPEYISGRDYSVVDQRVSLIDALRGDVSTQQGLADVVSANAVGWYSLPTSFTFEQLTGLGAKTLLIETGPEAGPHEIVGVSGSVLEVKTPLQNASTATFRVPRYHAKNVPPNNYWAELAFFDNWQTIQGNFGLMVGLPKQYLLDEDINVDYLTVVRALCFAFMSGPTLDNLGLLADSFIGVPFVEHSGQVVRIVEPSSVAEGHVVVHDEYGRDTRYRYPYGATLALHPTTQTTITEYPLVERPDKLSASEKAVYDSAVLPANTRLFAVTQVDDYISDDALITSFLDLDNYLSKYHTFVVRVPLEIAGTTSALSLIKTYLNEAKAAYTKFILVGTMLFSDDLDVEDSVDAHVVLNLKDTPHTTPISHNTADSVASATYSLIYPSLPLAPDYLTQKAFADGSYNSLDDAVERHESGYQEGVLDDYSGDGSVNAAHSEIDQVNQFDFDDIDVCSSLLWMPITKDTVVAPLRDFVIGEEILLLDNNGGIVDAGDYVWNASPPVIVHIGCGNHLKTPHAYSPQHTHPDTYLVIGFHRPATQAGLTDSTQVLTNYGTEKRLNGWYYASLVAVGPLRVAGKTSGAYAQLPPGAPDYLVDRTLFNIVRINQFDKLNEYNLRDEAVIQQTMYIPVGGATIAAVTAAFEAANLVAREAQVQQFPYNSTIPSNKQFVPSTTAGVYTRWAGSLPGDAFQLDYDDVGPVDVTPTAITGFLKNPASTNVENLHIGMKFTRAGGWHYTHGFVTYSIPKPEIVKCTYAALTARIEGNYFIAPDVTATIHTDNPNDYDGTISGSWVFASQNGAEIAAGIVTFETGLVPATTVLGIDGAVQTATGHVLTANFAWLPAGTYDIIVRQYRPYEQIPGSGRVVHMDESIFANGAVVP